MKEKKYKAWDKRSKQMCRVIEIRIGSMVYLEPKVGHPFYRDITDVDLLEYIGVKDKNNREIYEKDRVKEIWTIHTVVWSKGDCGFSPFITGKLNPNNCEVIGNSYKEEEERKNGGD